MTEGTLGRRLVALAAVIIFFFAALVTRLWFLQVLATNEFQERSEANRVRLVALPAPRGRILDRNGVPLVTNRPTTVLTVDRTEVEDEEELLVSLSGLLETSVEELRERLHDPNYLPHQPVPIADSVTKTAAFYVAEHPDEFPGVAYERVGVRKYVQGDLAPHLLGYLAEVTREELEDPDFAELRPGQKVGRGGVEQRYEQELRGQDGWLKLEVDASGKALNVLGRQEPVPGNDLVLAVDAEIQGLAQETMAEAVEVARNNVFTPTGYVRATAGSVIVLDVRTGHVLAMASYPTYDPEIFQGGLTNREFQRLLKPNRNFPLNNRAISGLYPPASTFKPFVAAAAVRAGLTSLGDFHPCPPEFVVPGDTSGTVFHNWKETHSGTISLAQSLVESCDTVYYQFGLDFYRQRPARGELFQQQMRGWGFGERLGIDIPGEAAGRVPDDEWKDQIHELYPKLFPEGIWLPGDNINLSIGQGDILTTPLQVAAGYAAIANGGEILRPQVGLKVVAPDGDVVKRYDRRVVRRVPARPEVLRYLMDAMEDVSTRGTAASAFAGFPLSIASKTGTAEAIVDGQDVLHSWFAAVAPANEPRYAVLAMVEEGGHGSEVAAPIVRRVLEGLMDLTPGEFRIGVPTD